MMDELPAYSWQRVGGLSNGRGLRRGDTRRNGRGTEEWNGVGCWLKGAARRGFAEPVGSFASGSLRDSRDRSAASLWYIPRPAGIRRRGLRRAKQIFGASPLKTRDQPTDELICFPTTPLSSLLFFPLFPSDVSARLCPSPSPAIGLGLPLPLARLRRSLARSRAPSSPVRAREYSSIYPKMTPISQVKCKRGLVSRVYRATCFSC